MVLAPRISGDKPVNERKVNTQFGQQFDSARLHFFLLTWWAVNRLVVPTGNVSREAESSHPKGGLTQVLSKSLSDFACFNGGEERIG